jgi:hypothetical protein
MLWLAVFRSAIMSSKKYEKKYSNETSDWVSPWTLLLRAIAKQKAKERSLETLLFSPSIQLKSEGKLSCQGKLLLALAVSGFFALASASGVQARDYFVGLTGDNSDGLTAKTAWNELDQIKWEQIKDGDLIKIAGGTYRKTLKINFQSVHLPQYFHTGMGYGVGISPATSTDRVVIEGSATNRVGVDFGNSIGVVLAAQSCDRLIIKNFPLAGVQFGPQSSKCFLFDAQVQDNLYGLRMDGNSNHVYWSDIHDNTQNVLVQNSSHQPGRVAAFMNTWIHNKKFSYSSNGIYAVSPIYLTQLAVSNCVIGPGLSNGILMNGTSPKLEAGNCLFLNSYNFNVRALTRYYAPNAISLYQCTSYMTQLNPLGRPHGAISLNTGTVSLFNNIFYQGVAALPPATVQVSGQGNVAFKTTGTPIPGVTTDPDLKGVLPGAKINNPLLTDLVDSDYKAYNRSLPQPVPQSITSLAQLKQYLYR